MQVGPLLFYIISIAGMMLGPFIFARYLAYRWRMTMMPFYGGAVVFLIVYLTVLFAMFEVKQLFTGAPAVPNVTQVETYKQSITVATSLFLALFTTVGTFLFFRFFIRERQSLYHPILFGIGTTSVGAFLSGFVLAYAIIATSVAGLEASPGSVSLIQSQTPQIEHQSNRPGFAVRSPVWAPLLPLIRVLVYLPWFILFAIFIFWGITRSQPLWVMAAFFAQFGVGLAAALLTPPAPANQPNLAGTEILRLVLALPPVIFIRGLLKAASRERGTCPGNAGTTGNGDRTKP